MAVQQGQGVDHEVLAVGDERPEQDIHLWSSGEAHVCAGLYIAVHRNPKVGCERGVGSGVGRCVGRCVGGAGGGVGLVECGTVAVAVRGLVVGEYEVWLRLVDRSVSRSLCE